jgi:hypothetical protein
VIDARRLADRHVTNHPLTTANHRLTNHDRLITAAATFAAATVTPPASATRRSILGEHRQHRRH